jgi:hypothetical protein
VARDDANVNIVYLHDDNLGPNARFRIVDVDDPAGVTIDLHPEAPPPMNGAWPTTNPTQSYGTLTPVELVVAVHHELRTAPLALQRAAIESSAWLPDILEHDTVEEHAATGMLVGSRFLRLQDYVDGELRRALRQRPADVLARARLELWEKVPPMSLHIGLVRVSLGTVPMMDVLFDTSDSDRHLKPTAYVAYHEQVPWLMKRFSKQIEALDLGCMVQAW